MARTTCRNGRHPITDRIRKSNGGTECSGCYREAHAYRNETRPVDADGSVDPAIFAATRQWLAAWATGVDAVIARIRDEEGFNGRRQRWQTLGEYLQPDEEPPVQVVAPKSVVPYPSRLGGRCSNCGAPRRNDAPCNFCATVLRKVAS